MLDDTLLLTVYGLMIVMTSGAHCHVSILSYNHTHTIAHIQAYTYNHAMMLHTCMWNIPMKSCTYPWSLRLPPVQFSGMIVGSLVSAPATRAVYESDSWILGLCRCHLQFIKSFAFAPATWQLTRPIFKMLVSAPATVGVQRMDCQIPGLCACHPCSLRDRLSKLLLLRLPPCSWPGWFWKWWCLRLPPVETPRDWLSDPWALRLPPVQFTRLMVRSLVSALHLPPGSLPGWLSDPCSACRPCNLRQWWLVVLCACHPQLTELIFKLLVCAPALRAVCQVKLKKCWCARLPPVQWSGLIVRFLASAPVTRAVYQSDGWILGLCTCHPSSTRSWVRFCIYCHFTESMPPLSSRFFKPTPSWRFDISLQALRSPFCLSGFQAGSSWDCSLFRAMLSFILLLWFALCVLEPFCQIQRCHWSLVAVCRHVLRISLSRLCPCFSFCPQRRDVSIWCFRFLRSCCVEWFSRRLVLRLFPLPCHVVCHTFVWARAALDQAGYASNSALSVFSFDNVF